MNPSTSDLTCFWQQRTMCTIDVVSNSGTREEKDLNLALQQGL